MRKIILSLVAAAAIASPLAMSATANADVSNNGTTNDAWGYCIANHIANFNGDNHGIGKTRSGQTGQQISATAGHNAPSVCVDTQGQFTPISAKAAASPTGQAVDMAKSYLSHMAFSKTGLAEQLVYEGFSPAVANKAVNSIRVNWRAQAVKMAKSYLSHMAFSCSGLVEQLVYEGFSTANATYGANQTRAC